MSRTARCSGKGATTIINNLCLWPGSIVVVDPKGENATVTAARRGPGSEYCEGMGQAVHVLDPFCVAQVDDKLRSCFNPLDALDPSDPEVVEEAGRIASAIIVPNHEKADQDWDDMARDLVEALILHILTAPAFDGRRNLVTLRSLLLRGDQNAAKALEELGEKEIGSGHELLFAGMIQNPAFEEHVAGQGEFMLETFRQAPKQYKGIMQSALVNTKFLASPKMRECLSHSDFRLADLKTDPNGVSVYLSLPQRHMPTHFRWLRMMIALIVTEMEKVKGQPATGHPVLMCLDEFASLKRMEVIENAFAQLAGFGVKLFVVLQSLEQLKGTYKDHWETFLANSSLKIFYGLEDHFSREYVSKFIGDTELIRETKSRNQSRTEGDSSAHGVTKGESRTDSVNQSRNASVGQGTTHSTNEGENWNASRNSGWQTGSGTGENFKAPWLLRDTARYFSLMRSDETLNKNIRSCFRTASR